MHESVVWLICKVVQGTFTHLMFAITFAAVQYVLTSGYVIVMLVYTVQVRYEKLSNHIKLNLLKSRHYFFIGGLADDRYKNRYVHD